MKRAGFSPQTEQIIRQAGLLARELGHSYVGTEHLLLAILQQRELACCCSGGTAPRSR